MLLSLELSVGVASETDKAVVLRRDKSPVVDDVELELRSTPVEYVPDSRVEDVDGTVMEE